MELANATQDAHNSRITELIYDEEKIITSALLANELQIPRNDAQNLLDSFIKKHEDKKSDVHVTYLLYGLLKDEKSLAIYLVKEEDLNDKRNLFEKIATEVIYSLQKGKQVDFNVIALANSVEDNGIPNVRSKNCIKRNIKSKKILVTKPTIVPVKQNGTAVNNSPSTSSEKLNGDNHKSLSQKQHKGKQGGIANFFSKAATKSQSCVKVESIPNKKSEKLKPEVELALQITSPKESVNDQQTLQDEKMDTNQEREKSVIERNQDKNTNKKRKKANKDKGPNKKRKRIQKICDSDSDDIFDDGENNDIIEMSDEEPVNPPAVNPPPIPKNKKRKTVDKTYMDDEGFIVTTTEYVYETASEGEEKESLKPKPDNKVLIEKKVEKNSKNSSDVKPSGGKGKNKKVISGKQPTLMSFFKKN